MSRITTLTLASLALAAATTGVAACGDDDEPASRSDAKAPAAKVRPLPVQSQFPVVPDVEYRTTLFKPTAKLKLPAGAWSIDWPESREHVAVGLAADPGVNLVGFAIHHMTKVADPRSGARSVADAVAGPKDFIAWLADHPRLEASAPTDVTVNGMKGRQIDVQPQSFPPKQPTSCKEEPPRQPCLVLWFSGAEPFWYYASGKVRFTAFDVDGQQVVVEQFVDPAERFDAIAKSKLDPALNAVSFGS